MPNYVNRTVSSIYRSLGNKCKRSLCAGVAIVTLQGAAIASVPCDGGTLDITVGSNLPFTLPAVNAGQRVELSAALSGVSASAFSWTIGGPVIKDYEERLGTVATGSIPWSTSPLAPADLTASTISFFWVPTINNYPAATPASPRNVTLEVTTVSGLTCTINETYQLEVDHTNPDKQPVDYYTSNHRAPTETNPLKGVVIDDHQDWHNSGSTRLYPFLEWHGKFLARFDDWRTFFGYKEETPWNPGTDLPGGVDYQHFTRQPTYTPANNMIPTYYTIAGGATDFSGATTGPKRLSEYSSFSTFQNQFEFSWHGVPHCNIGPWGPAPFGSMCAFSSPKDPIFWRWHGFIDEVYKNFCHVNGSPTSHCASPAGPTTDLWMADNNPDITNNGAPPSPHPRWVSPDIWNRTAPVACTPSAHPDSGIPRDCGSTADHDNPIAGQDNYLYATIRNDRPAAAKLAYAEIAVYAANASTGLSWPADFTQLPETRQLIVLNLEAGQTTDIGPLVWTPPDPTPSDHWCLYIRVLAPQDALDDNGGDEGASVDVNTRDHNSIAWRNVKILPAGSMFMFAGFTIRNINERTDALTLDFELPNGLLDRAVVGFEIDEDIAEKWPREVQGGVQVNENNYKALSARFPLPENAPMDRTIILSENHVRFPGIRLESGGSSAISMFIRSRGEPLEIDSPITITQLSGDTVDGGVTIMPGKEMNIRRQEKRN